MATTNENGLTFYQWLCAAGFRLPEKEIPTSSITLKNAWMNGEDTSEWRLKNEKSK